MKRNALLTTALLAAVMLSMAPSYALSESQIKSVQRAVEKVRLPELGAKAAKLVSQAPAADKKDVALTAVKAIVTKHPATAPSVVGAVVKVVPQFSAEIAAAAAAISPEQAAAIAKAAAAVVPDQAKEIAVAVSKVARKSAVQIARAVIDAVPMAAPKIAESMTAAIPETKGQVQVARTRSTATGAAVNPFGTIITTSGEGTDIRGNNLDGSNTKDANTQVGEDGDRDAYGRPK